MTGMVRTLQKRFIAAAMAAVTVLLLVLVGAINGLHILSVRSEENRMLEMLADNGGIPGDLPGTLPDDLPGFNSGWQQNRPGRPSRPSDSSTEGYGRDADNRSVTGGSESGDERGSRNTSGTRGWLRVGRFTMDNVMSMRFFLVWFGDDGAITRVDTSNILLVTEEQAKEMAAGLRSSGPSRGRTGSFRYLVREDLAVFLDVSEQESSVKSVLLITVLIAAVCWVLTALLVVALSHRAILPVARNIERQKEFVTNAGHEIKTPLAIISANAEALELYKGENKWTRNIRAQVVRLNGLMQDLLTLSGMEESESLKKEEVDLTSLAREVGEEFSESAAAAGLQLVLPRDMPVTVLADRRTLRQLVSILLDNAVKYTPEGGTISLETESAGSKAFLRQYNTITPGTEEKDPSRLFERFYRSDKARTQKSGGYGIGLSAARAIAEANGGSLSASYEKLRANKGSDPSAQSAGTGKRGEESGILFTLRL